LVVLLAACGGAPPTVAETAPPEAATSAPPRPAAPPPAETSPEADPPAVAEPRFFEIARSSEPKHELRVMRLGDEVVVTLWNHIVPLKNDRIDVTNNYSEGLLAFGQLIAVGGKWPTDAWLTYITSNGRIGWGELYGWKKSVWLKQTTLRQGEVYLGMSTWTGGRLLTLSIDNMPFLHPMRHTFRAVGGGAVPKLARGKGKCPYQTRPHGFTALESGHVFVIGQRCRQDDVEETVIEWWAPGAQKSTITALPGAKLGGAWYDETPVSAIALGPDDILIAGGRFVVRFDGKEFRPLETPASKVAQLARTNDGTVWGLFDGEVHSWDTKNAWKREPLAGDAVKATSLAVVGKDVFVTAGPSVYGPRQPKPNVQVFTFEAPGEVKSFEIARPADKYCESVFALLYAFTKVTPDNYDFPLTRQALKGQTKFGKVRFVVTEEAERKYLGAFTPTLALGKELVARIEKEVKGSKPALLCVRPRVLREFPLDLATGELAP